MKLQMQSGPCARCGMVAMILLACFIASPGTLSAHAMAQDAGDQDAKQSEILRGPDVADDGLIRTDFQGNFIPVQGRPEEAGIALLGLDIERSEQARTISDAWIMQFGDFLIDELELLKKASDLTRAGKQDEAQQIYVEMFRKHAASESRDPLFKKFAEILSDDEQQQLQTLIDNYWDAWIDWELRSVINPTAQQREQTRNRLAFQLFQYDLSQAFRIALQSHSQRLERIYAVVEPTDEQRAQIREIVLDYIRQTRFEPEAAEQGKVTAAIFGLLTEEQRQAAVAYMIWQ